LYPTILVSSFDQTLGLKLKHKRQPGHRKRLEKGLEYRRKSWKSRKRRERQWSRLGER